MRAETALVTGGAGGLGVAVAKALRATGHRVVLLGRSATSLVAACGEVPGATHVVGDVTDRGSVAAAVAEATRRGGAPLILVNAAGIAESRSLLPPDDALWQRSLDVNVTGPWIVATECLPAMVAAGWGRIVNVASTAALRAFRYTAAYTASKHALLGLTRALAEDLAARGVTANAVCPGFLDTPMTDRTIENVARKTGRTLGEARAIVAAMNARGALVPPVEVAREVVRLVEDGSVTGQAIVVE
jgi:NAD(P)-dependent dehydrogenase (short-subunit alcohol dehydrogenase family)